MLAHRDVYYTPAWYRLKEYALARDGHICCNCSWCGADVAHHLTYAHGIICPHEFLVTLCKQCHRLVHGFPASVRDHYEVYQARRGYELVAESEPGCVGQWAGKDFRYWAPRGKPFCLSNPPLLKGSGDWRRILADASQRYSARSPSERLCALPVGEVGEGGGNRTGWGTGGEGGGRGGGVGVGVKGLRREGC